jgi:hypothetical protein
MALIRAQASGIAGISQDCDEPPGRQVPLVSVPVGSASAAASSPPLGLKTAEFTTGSSPHRGREYPEQQSGVH